VQRSTGAIRWMLAVAFTPALVASSCSSNETEASPAAAGPPTSNEATDLPDGAEVELTLVEGEFDPEERARLDAALELSMAQARAGQFVDGDAVIRKLRAGR